MALEDNRPTVERLRRQLRGAPLDNVDDDALRDVLDASTSWVEDLTTIAFNGRAVVRELYDGNGTNSMAVRKRPVTSVQLVTVQLPVLALTRTYLPSEIKLYSKEGRITVFTYKLAAQNASIHLDQMVYGNIFPVLPQCVQVSYTYGFPCWDEEQGLSQLAPALSLPEYTLANGEVQTPFEQDAVTVPYDWRAMDTELANWLVGLQQAVLCDAAASVLAQLGRLTIGTLQSVSFDGLSQGNDPQAYAATIQDLIGRRDEILNRRRRSYHMATIG